MSLYAISLQPLITRLQVKSAASQCWYADDATGCGSLGDVKTWWDELMVGGPPLGYFPNPQKCWLIVKSERERLAKEIFGEININITTEGRKHLGAALGSRVFFEEYVDEKVGEWVAQVTRLAELATTQPQSSYAAFVFGPRHRWTYFLRTLPDITPFLEPCHRACHSGFACTSYHRACYHTGRKGSFRTPSSLRRAWASQSSQNRITRV